MRNFNKILLLLSIFMIYCPVKADPIVENSDDKSSDTTLKDVVINSEKVVCSDYICEKIIENNDVNSVIITYKTNDENAVVSEEKLEKDLNEGLNEFKVVVTAEDGTTKDYTFKITKKILSTDSSLKKITVNGNEIALIKDFSYLNTVSGDTNNNNKVQIYCTSSSINNDLDPTYLYLLANKDKKVRVGLMIE